MNHKTTWLMASLLGMTAIAARSSEMPLQTQRAALQQPIKADGVRRFSDLYSVTWEEIPIPQEALQNFIWATSITDDGAIAGKQGDALVLWHPDTQVWERVPRVLAPKPVFISPDGSSVVAVDDPGRLEQRSILTWNRAAGWQVLAGSMVADPRVTNVSSNFQFAVGGGINSSGATQAWIWRIDGGALQLLPIPDWAVDAAASAVSDDGSVVIGNASRALQPGDFVPERFAVRWVDGGSPTILRTPDGIELDAATACNADCSTVFGYGPWFLKDNGEFEFLGTLPDAYPVPGSWKDFNVTDASSDGSVVVGFYSQNVYPTNPNSETYAQRPFIWTQAAGMTSLRSLGVGDEDWQLIDTVCLSPDGRRILIAGVNQSSRPRAAVVHLTPKTVRLTSGHSTHATPVPPRADPNKTLRAGSRAVVD